MPRPSLDLLLDASPRVGTLDASYFGPLIFGVVCDTIFLGFIIDQLNSYLSHAVSRDTLANKLALFWASAVAAASTGLGIWYTWDVFVIHFGAWKPTPAENTRGIAWFVLLNTLMTLPMQLFFAARAYRTHACGPRILYLVLPLVLIATVSGMGLTGAMRSLRKDDQVQRLAPWVWIWNSANLLCNVVLGLAVFTSLYKTQSWGTRRDHWIFRLLRITFELVLPCTAQSLGSLICHAARPYSPIAWVWLVLAKIYLISAFAVLNSRTRLRRPVQRGSSEVCEIRTFPLDEHTVVNKPEGFVAREQWTTNSSETYTQTNPPAINDERR